MPLLADTTLTELDLSGIGFGSEGAVAVAKYISDNGALTSLNLSSNRLYASGAKAVAEAIEVTNVPLRSFWYQLHVNLTTGSTAVVC
jgi:Ran GTPase-activating protein (RanGAP) involved in mRNA processing and transport